MFALLLLTGASSATVNFYTGTVNTLFYESLVSGNSVLDVIYDQFNTTGFLLTGAALLAASGESVGACRSGIRPSYAGTV